MHIDDHREIMSNQTIDGGINVAKHHRVGHGGCLLVIQQVWVDGEPDTPESELVNERQIGIAHIPHVVSCRGIAHLPEPPRDVCTARETRKTCGRHTLD